MDRLALQRRDWLRWACTVGTAAAWPCRAASQSADPPPERRPWPARTATPPLDLPGLRLADARGKVLLLNFWASWCEPCRTEMPSLELLAERCAPDGLQVVAVNYRETDAALRRYVESTALSLPVVRDADGAAAKSFAVRIFPTSVLIARDGRVAFSVVGACDWNAEPARGWVATLLAARR